MQASAAAEIRKRAPTAPFSYVERKRFQRPMTATQLVEKTRVMNEPVSRNRDCR
jgi:hypothetical protein